jgi:HEAT repeat protein
VAIRASAAKEIDTLIADLTGPHAVAREAAIARLTVIGARAVERLLLVAQSSTEPAARVSAFRALEGIRDPRSLGPALKAASSEADPRVAAAAVGVARPFIRQDRGASVVDQLTKLALDAHGAEAVRLAAITALKDLDAPTVAPLLKTLAGDSKPAIRAEAARPADAARSSSTASGRAARTAEADALLARAADEGLPENPDQLREALTSATRTTTLAALLRVVERVREKEAGESQARREKWTTARAAGHLALARRRSRIGLYDLREWLESARAPLPVDAFAALALVGDASCLEAIASRYGAPSDEWSKSRLADLFRAIVKREAVSRRHPVIKRIERRQKPALDELWRDGGDSRRNPKARR